MLEPHLETLAGKSYKSSTVNLIIHFISHNHLNYNDSNGTRIPVVDLFP